jgi:hypothetical protein
VEFFDGIDGAFCEGIEDESPHVGSTSDRRSFDCVCYIDYVVVVRVVVTKVVIVSFGIAIDNSINVGFKAGSAFDTADVLVNVVCDGWRWYPPSRLFAAL